MKDTSLLLIASALLLLPIDGRSLAAEDADMRGAVELGGRIVDSDDESAKFMEYRDLDDGFIGNFNFDYARDSYFFGAEGQNVGLDDQFYQITGGSYEKFKYAFFYDEIPHNLSFGARTFYSGIGSDNLTIDTSTPASQNTWKSFDYEVKTKKYGADVKVNLAAPFYFNFGVNRQEKDGLKPLGSGGFAGVVEMPEPVNYKTNNFTVDGGYRSDQLSFKLSGWYSTFQNDNNFLDWQNPFSGVTETNSLPADNNYAKIAANMIWRQLPLMSTLLVNGSYTNLSSDFSVYEIGAAIPAGLNQTSFDGDISTTRLSASFASHPVQKMDTRLFYEYYDRDNDSTVIEYDDDGNASHLFDYSKNRMGLDANYKLPFHTRINGGYTYESVDRNNRPDGDSNTDNLVFLKLKNTSLDFITARIEYSYLNRDTDENHDLTGLTITDAEYITQFVQRFDVVSKAKNALKFAFEFSPLDTFDFGLAYTYVNNDYHDVTLGRTADKGHEFYVDFMWRAAKILNLSGFAGYEKYQADSNHYNFSVNQFADPTIDDGNPATYRWYQSIDTDFWTVGLSSKIPLLQDRLQLNLSWQYQKADGSSDFTTEGLAPLLPINNYDDYHITTLDAKVAYALTDAMDVTLGYMYEKLTYEDNQYDGYNYNPSLTYLSGAYTDHDYENNVGYLTIRYKF
ncbi:hypothetical protein FCL47_11405 [Desulfopila sp. IMCC35006]|uniref:MtrB/PioB family outer membrane beta-barrel protein n=1 Tax=Desulfopila sp. IMCC35006 TaxID=2569542 RepID=UPI0010AD851E|nr:MtrB/PioB family outer membrane beta-barrel protein [Desulfopila sp. IMCC35006]TKB26323.1 hypothetical protein FCL47_11405 [Desulfopila sp. IMCC35006]